jgi:hypothetical protein
MAALMYFAVALLEKFIRHSRGQWYIQKRESLFILNSLFNLDIKFDFYSAFLTYIS